MPLHTQDTIDAEIELEANEMLESGIEPRGTLAELDQPQNEYMLRLKIAAFNIYRDLVRESWETWGSAKADKWIRGRAAKRGFSSLECQAVSMAVMTLVVSSR